MVGKRHRIWTDIDKDKLGQGGRETELRILGFGNEGIGHLTPPFHLAPTFQVKIGKKNNYFWGQPSLRFILHLIKDDKLYSEERLAGSLCIILKNTELVKSNLTAPFHIISSRRY